MLHRSATANPLIRVLDCLAFAPCSNRTPPHSTWPSPATASPKSILSARHLLARRQQALGIPFPRFTRPRHTASSSWKPAIPIRSLLNLTSTARALEVYRRLQRVSRNRFCRSCSGRHSPRSLPTLGAIRSGVPVQCQVKQLRSPREPVRAPSSHVISFKRLPPLDAAPLLV